MKKHLLLSICLILSFLFSACGGSSARPQNANQAPNVADIMQNATVNDTENASEGKSVDSSDTAKETSSGSLYDDFFADYSDEEETTDPNQDEFGRPIPQASDLSKQIEGDFDVDLTTLSGTMVYSEVYNMMNNPTEYLGKTVKMEGTFAVYEGNYRNYYACVVADALACCSQGIEFLLDEEHVYPDDYPELGTNIIVTGVFDMYSEDDYTYFQLINAKMYY
ncbi:MAG: hypothetical protein IJM37_10565 [Lachnospiraceae bacterium]|nr:hypothetical protein [Lachnospiraceae bacterium]